MVPIRPILDKVVVKVEKAEESTRGGIILAGKSGEQPLVANVIARGPGGLVDSREVKMYINPGDKVLIPRHVGTEFTLDGTEYLIVTQAQILAIIS